MNEARYLIVNADDFGQSEGINRGIIEAHERGIVTSASLMVRWPAAANAAAYARTRTNFSVGLHFDLYEMSYSRATWEWEFLYRVAHPDEAAEVTREFTAQLEEFRRLMGTDPTHIDSHQHVHRSNETVREVLLEASRKLGAPLRDFSDSVRYSGAFYGQAGKGYAYPEGINVDSLLCVIRELPQGVTELGCHPGYADDIEGMYTFERAEEVRTLCDPRVRDAIEAADVKLCTFHDLSAAASHNAAQASPTD